MCCAARDAIQAPVSYGGSDVNGRDLIVATCALRWGLSSDVGRVRRVNQDAALANGFIFVVADGMGGHQGGEIASALTVEHLTTVERVDSSQTFASEVLSANTAIRERGREDAELNGMGTTFVGLAVTAAPENGDAPQLAAVNVGDSRLYVLESGSFEQITEDHSLVAELLRSGQITDDEALTHPQRNVVTRALGVEETPKVDEWNFPAKIGQRFLLCSDGLINEVSDQDIEYVLRSVLEPKHASQHLVEMANRAGGRDNVTVLVIDVIEWDPDATSN